MSTTAQANANRANSQHSTGPTTDAGKHGLQIAPVNHAVQVFIQLLGVVQLERRHGDVGGRQILAQIRAHFHLPLAQTIARADDHYRSTRLIGRA